MKRISFLLLFTAAYVAVNAQSLGIKAGVNYSNIIKSGDDDFKTEFKPGFHAGLTVDVPLVSGLSFAPELMYSQKGYKVSGTNILFGDYENSITTNFIEVPVLLKIKAASVFNIHVGPQVSFLTSTKTSFKQGSAEYEEKVEEDNDNLKKSLFGGVIGAGINIGAKTVLSARYALDFQKNNEDGTSETPEYRNQVFQVGLGFRL